MEEPTALTMLRRLLTVQQDQIRHISDLSRKLVEAHFVIRDHFWSLSQKHQALVVLLEDLGVLGQERLKDYAEGCVGRFRYGSPAVPLVRILSDPDSASAILVSAGSSSLSALCCASRSCIETLATLLVQVPTGEVAGPNEFAARNGDLQAQLWQSLWWPTLTVWEAQAHAQPPATACGSAVDTAPPAGSWSMATGETGNLDAASGVQRTEERRSQCQACVAEQPSEHCYAASFSPLPAAEAEPARRAAPQSVPAADAAAGGAAWPAEAFLQQVQVPAKRAVPGSPGCAAGERIETEKARPSAWKRSADRARCFDQAQPSAPKPEPPEPLRDAAVTAPQTVDYMPLAFLDPLPEERWAVQRRSAEEAVQLRKNVVKAFSQYFDQSPLLDPADLQSFCPVSTYVNAELRRLPKLRRAPPKPLLTRQVAGRVGRFSDASLRAGAAHSASAGDEAPAAEGSPAGEGDATARRQRSSAFTEMLRGRTREAVAMGAGHNEGPEEEVRRQLRDVALGKRAPHESSRNLIVTGQLVIVRGLSARPDLNEITGTVLSWFSTSNRWLVQLSTGEQVRLRRENLALIGWSQQPVKVLLLFKVMSALGLKMAEMVGLRQLCDFKACSKRLRRSARSHLELIIYGGSGGKCSGRRLERLNPNSGAWKVCPPSNHTHHLGCAAVVDGNLIVAGGIDSFATRFVEIFEVASNTWEELPRLRHPRYGAAAAVVGGRLHILGGVCDDQVLNSMESFLPGENKWEEEPWMEYARCLFGVGTIRGRLIVAGGQARAFKERMEALLSIDSLRRSDFEAQFSKNASRTDLSLLDNTEVYCPFAKRWKEVPSMHEQRCHPADACVRGLYFMCGGYDGSEYMRSAEVFEPEVGRWRRLPPMATARVGAGAASVEAAGMMLVAGGFDGRGVLRSVECFNLEQERWEGVLPMQIPRMGCSLSVIGECVYICGGYNREGPTSRLEGFCVRTKRRLRLPNIPVQRTEFLSMAVPV